MILYPAIDLKDGAAVRLVHGDMDRATVFNDDPAAQARALNREARRQSTKSREEMRIRRRALIFLGFRHRPGRPRGT